VPSGPGGHVESVEDEGRGHGACRLPAHQSAGVDVDDEGDIDDARPGGAVGEVSYPQSVWSGGGEVPVHEVRGPDVGGVGLGGEALLGPGGALDSLLAHEPGHLVTSDVDLPPPSCLPKFATSVDGVVLLPQGPELRAGSGVPDGPG
jgi:hypothetical protein